MINIPCISPSVLFIATMLLAIAGCGGGGASNTDPGDTNAEANVSPLLFGVNLSWNNLGEDIVDNGEQIQDRSFEIGTAWLKLENSGTVTFSATGGDSNPVGGHAYQGYAELSRNDNTDSTCVFQQLQAPVSAGVNYQMNFSSKVISGIGSLSVLLYDSTYTNVLASDATLLTTTTWTRHQLTLMPSTDAGGPILGICLTDAGDVQIDEVRFSRQNTLPSIKAIVKTRLQELGTSSLRWPGGSLADTFYWKQSVGPLLERGELEEFNQRQTPSLGLHEFLDVCEELDVVPLITVNTLDSAQNAADLIEYIYGDATTPQGAVRVANGRSAPWTDVRYFEIGNEPAQAYQGGGALEDAALNYVSLAKPIIAAMKAKAEELKVNIDVSGINEPDFQLADWLPLGSDPITVLLRNWNQQTFAVGSGLAAEVEFTHGHFYTFQDYEVDAQLRFEYLMSAGEVLRRTLQEKVTPFTGSLPLWISEYNVYLKDNSGIKVEHNHDFQSGLVLANILMSMIEQKIPAAHIWNFSETDVFGIVTANWDLRPNAMVFQLFSSLKGEKSLDVTLSSGSYDINQTYTVTSGKGNIPSGLVYPKVSAIATLDSAFKQPRIIILNRNFDTDVQVQPHVSGYRLTNAKVTQYANTDLSANNETDPNAVSLTSVNIENQSPFTVTVPAHSLLMLEFY